MVRFGAIERVVCFGGGPTLVDAVERARDHGFDPAVVTAPRQESGTVRGEPLVDLLDSMNVETVVCEDIDDSAAVESLIENGVLGLSFGAAWIFSAEFIDQFDGNIVNFHGSRLPRDRGGGGFSWRILRDDRMGYSQAHFVRPQIDAGDILLYDEYRFPDACTTPADFAAYANEREAALVADLLDGVATDREFEPVTQPEYLSSYWPRLSTEHHGYIDWDWSLTDIVRFIRAFSDPFDGAKTFVRGSEVRLHDCASHTSDGTFHPFQRGIVYRKHDGRAHVATPEGTLVVGTVRDEEGESVYETIRTGDRFYTPAETLESALRTRTYYTPTGSSTERY